MKNTNNRQVITGFGSMGPDTVVFGIPGTGSFLSVDSVKPGFGLEIARTRFPGGVIRNLKVSVLTNEEPKSGEIKIELHATGVHTNTSGTGMLVAFVVGYPGQDFNNILNGDAKMHSIEIPNDSKVSIKVANNLQGIRDVSFNYSFEFEYGARLSDK